MAARWTAWIVWAALAASLVFWGLRLSGSGAPVPVHARAIDTAQAVRGDVLRLFATAPVVDAAQPAPEAAARFRLVGVIAPSAAGAAGWALIGVDGKAARAVAVGAPVDGEWILQAVTQNRVEIGPRGAAAAAVLELASLPAAATGVLAMASPGGANAAPAPAGGAVASPAAGLAPPAAGPGGNAAPVPGSVNVGRLPGGAAQGRPVPGVPARGEAANAVVGEPAPEGVNPPNLR